MPASRLIPTCRPSPALFVSVGPTACAKEVVTPGSRWCPIEYKGEQSPLHLSSRNAAPMAIEVRLLNALRCPHTGGPLHIVGPEPLAALNQQIADGAVFTQLGTPVSEVLTEALVSADGRWLYRVEATIPQLIRGEAIPLVPPSN